MTGPIASRLPASLTEFGYSFLTSCTKHAIGRLGAFENHVVGTAKLPYARQQHFTCRGSILLSLWARAVYEELEFPVLFKRRPACSAMALGLAKSYGLALLLLKDGYVFADADSLIDTTDKSRIREPYIGHGWRFSDARTGDSIRVVWHLQQRVVCWIKSFIPSSFAPHGARWHEPATSLPPAILATPPLCACVTPAPRLRQCPHYRSRHRGPCLHAPAQTFDAIHPSRHTAWR
jgi:hypothetical protein